MKTKTANLIGRALDWAVAKADGISLERKQYSDPDDWVWYYRGLPFYPSQDWDQGGPIIERELLKVTPRFHSAGFKYPTGKWYWKAFVLGLNNIDENHEQQALTPLAAAMRCFVASKLGDEVDVPEELLNGA